MTTMTFSSSPTHYLPPISPLYIHHNHNHNHNHMLLSSQFHKSPTRPKLNKVSSLILSCTYSETTIRTFTTSFSDSDSYSSEEEYNNIESNTIPQTTSSNGGAPPPVLKKRKRYRKEYPGESKGITEEMRFVAMKLRNNSGNRDSGPSDEDEQKMDGRDEDDGRWEPTMGGFLKYLVDSKLVFETIERVVEDSNDVSYAYFRRTGLQRSECLERDLEWFGQQNMTIPEPSNPGVSYAAYLKELAEKSAPLFLSHFYNVYFSHIVGGQVIAKQVAEKLLGDRELAFYSWEGDDQELLREVREKLNRLGEHWSRDDKNKCLKEATKSFRYMGQIVRLIIL